MVEFTVFLFPAYLRNLTTGLEIEKVKAQNALRNNDKVGGMQFMALLF